jgi:DNA gyrase subunit A
MQTREEDFVSRLFVASTHTPVLFFSSHGRVYRKRSGGCLRRRPRRSKALINILPLEQGELVTTVMPLPEDEDLGQLDVMFATTRGTVRRCSPILSTCAVPASSPARRGRGSSTCRSAPSTTTSC